VENGDSAKRWFLGRLFDFFCTGFHDGIAPCTFHVGDSIQGPPSTFLEVCSTSTPLSPPCLNPHLINAGLVWPYITRMKSSQVCLSTHKNGLFRRVMSLGEHPPIYDAAPNFLFGRSDLLQMILTDLYERFLFSLFLPFSSLVNTCC
jgi:hypothetical protein